MIVITVQGQATAASQDLTQNPFLKVNEYDIPTRVVSPHFAHAVSAYATSGFRESDILVIDGIGSPVEDMSDGERSTVVNPVEAGKVIGLAPYGRSVFPVEEVFEMDGNRFVFSEKISSRFNHAERWPQHQEEYHDLAASTQNALEVALLYLVEHLYEHSPSDNFCYAGGGALNSIANERIIRESKFKNVYIMPAAEDSGTAIGTYGGNPTGDLLR